MKVRSSEEKAVAEQREKAEKVRAYRELTTRIFAKVGRPARGVAARARA